MNDLLRFMIVSSLLAITFFSCEDEVAEDIEKEENVKELLDMLASEDYFPIHIGDSLQITEFPVRTFDALEIIEGIEYFRQVSDHSTTWYRKTSTGKVYQKRADEDEYLRFDLSADIDEKWTYKEKAEGFTWHAKLMSKSDTVLIDDYLFTDCYRFYYDIEETADEEHTVWLAPGIGIVRISGQLGDSNVECARIDDIKFCL